MKAAYKTAIGIWYKSELNTITKKEKMPLRPLYEAFINSLEAITDNGEITISLFLTEKIGKKEEVGLDFQKITVEDSGIGFNDTEFERFINLRDNRKNPFNKGTGRVQFIHFFNKTIILSVYKDDKSSTGYKERKITLSKSDEFLDKNAIVRLDDEKEINADKSYTKLTFEGLLDNDKDLKYYSNLDSETIKLELIRHFLAWFCVNKNTLPQITIKTFINDKEESVLNITSDDIPNPIRDEDIDIHYSKIVDGKIERDSKKEKFNFKSFIIPEDKLNENGIKLVSKGEIAKDIDLYNLLEKEQIGGNRYLFLLSGKYIDERDSDTRGNINIVNRETFKKNNTDKLFTSEEVLFEDIEEITNRTVVSWHKEIQEKEEEKQRNIEELQKMFLLNNKTIDSLKAKISVGDSDEHVLEKVYEADAKIIAKKDAEIKRKLKEVESLATDSKDYQNLLKAAADDFVKIIPLQNRMALIHYIARRRLVLNLFQKILDKELDKLRKGERIEEKLMHNLIFQQSSNNPEDSDLWLLGDEYIHFKGFSEHELKDISIDGVKIFKEEFEDEEKNYLNSNNEKRLAKRPDILLFPEEGKCIIIELKAPDENVSKHLTQINFYASLIRNYTIDKYNIVAFYGYLIGENIEDRDVRGRVSSFEHSSNLDYWFRPSEKVTGFNGRSDGSIYTEVIKYSTLLKRAKLRNEIFISKLEK